MAQPQGKNMNVLHAMLGYLSEVITQATHTAMGLNLTVTFKLFEHCALGKS